MRVCSGWRTKPVVLHHKLMECGHSQMEVDSLHSMIERTKKTTLDEKPYSVTEMRSTVISLILNFWQPKDLKIVKRRRPPLSYGGPG